MEYFLRTEKDAVWGPLFQKFHGEETGKEACRAVGEFCVMRFL